MKRPEKGWFDRAETLGINSERPTVHAFQACLIDRSSISPFRINDFRESPEVSELCRTFYCGATACGRGGPPPVALTTADIFGESASDDDDDWIAHVRNFWRSDHAVRSRSCVISSSAVRP
jgi:hypothetical protein